MALGKRLINTGAAAACTTDSTDPFGDSSGVALYNLDYDASDASGNYDGTPSNVDFGVEGKINYGARFNGSSSKIVIPSIDWTTLSISFWINARSDSEGGNRNNVATDGSINRNCIFINKNYITDGRVPLNSISYFDNNYANSVSATWEDDTWIHIVVTLDGQDMAIYKNGVLADSATISGRPTGNKTYNWGKNGASFFTGDLDQIRIFSKAINQTEVDTLYAETACVYTSTTDIVDYPTSASNDIVAYYKLDNSSEDFKGSYDGTDSNIEYRFGRFGQAADFNGSSSKITLPTGSPFNDSDTIKAVSAWVKADTSTSRVFPLSISSTSNANDYWYIGYMGDLNAIYIATRDGSSSNQSIVSASITSDTNWHHLVVQITATEKEIYLDGVKQTITNSNSGSGTNTSWISYPSYSGTVQGAIGVLRLSSPQYSNGFVDQVRIYDAALTDSQVTELYNEKPEVDTSNFKAVLYEGDSNTSGNYISNVGFQPDLVWIKFRNTAVRHLITDSVNGASVYQGAGVTLHSNETFVSTTYGEFTSFDANGFTVRFSSGSQYFNTSGLDYVAWCWKGGGDAVLNEQGTIDSQVSANTAAGFSIVKYTGSGSAMSVGHGLSSAPELVFFKSTNAAANWLVLTNSIDGSADYLTLNSTAAKTDLASGWLPDSTNLNFPTSSGLINNSNGTQQMIAYCWHSVSGHSKISTYTGATSGVTVNVGFAPSFVLIKNTTQSDYWGIFDNKRPSGTGNRSYIYPNTSDDEDVYASNQSGVTLTSTGFAVDNTNSNMVNENGETFLYMAFK